MVSLDLTEDQVMDLARKLPAVRKRELAREWAGHHEPAAEDDVVLPHLVDKDGILVIAGTLAEDISDIVDRHREERINNFIAELGH